MKVTVAITVLNEKATLPDFFAAMRQQTLSDYEIVLADGGSTDGTREWLLEIAAAMPALCVLEMCGATIGAGRNAAIAAASTPWIAVTDAGCRPEPDWLERIVAPLAAGADVVSGVFVPQPASDFERMVVALLTTPLAELTPTWNPSSRSMAFTKLAWEKVGGYPEDVPTAEDTAFCQRLRAAGYTFALAREAVVRWLPRPSYGELVHQYTRYAYGDGLSGISVRHYLTKIGLYSFFAMGIIAAASAPIASQAGHPGVASAGVAAAGVWALYHARYVWKMLSRGAGARAALYEPVLMTSYDVAEIVGFLRGHRDRRKAGQDA